MCNDVLKTNFACIRKWSYPSVNDTEKYDRNTEPGIPLKYGDIRSRRPYLAVYGRERAWAFDLGRIEASLLRLNVIQRDNDIFIQHRLCRSPMSPCSALVGHLPMVIHIETTRDTESHSGLVQT